MSKEKIDALKNKIKRNLPIIIAATSTAAAVGILIYYKKKPPFDLTREEVGLLLDDNIAMRYKIDGVDFTLRRTASTPPVN